MNPPEMRDIDMDREGDEQPVKGDEKLDLEMSGPKRKRRDAPPLTPLTPKKRFCSEAKKKEPEVPEPVQTKPQEVQSDAKTKMPPPSKTRALTRRTLPRRNVVEDIEKKDIQDLEKPVAKTENKESPETASPTSSPSKQDLDQKESQPTEEVSLQPTLKSRTRSRTIRTNEELPNKNHEKVVNESKTKSTRSRASIPDLQQLSEKVPKESVVNKDQPTKVTKVQESVVNKDVKSTVTKEQESLVSKDETTAVIKEHDSVANKDEATKVTKRQQSVANKEETTMMTNVQESEFNKDETITVRNRNLEEERLPLRKRRGGRIVAATGLLSESNPPLSQSVGDEVDVVSRRFRKRITEEPSKEDHKEPSKEESPMESLKSNLGKKTGKRGKETQQENSKPEPDTKPVDLSAAPKQIETISSTTKTPELATDPSLVREKKTSLKGEKKSSETPQKERLVQDDNKDLQKRSTQSLANLSPQVSTSPTMVRMAEGERIVVILNKAMIAEAKKRYRQLNPRFSLKRLTKRVGKLENEMKRMIARNELRGRLTFLLHIDLKQHGVSCVEVMKRDVNDRVVTNGNDGTKDEGGLDERRRDLETRRGRSRRGEVIEDKEELEATKSTRRPAREPRVEAVRKGSQTKTRRGRAGEKDGGEMDLFYQICPLRPCSLTKGGAGQSCGRRGRRRGRKGAKTSKRAEKRKKKTSLRKLARDPTNLTRGNLLALHAFTYDGTGVNLWDDDDDDEEEEERKRAWRSAPYRAPILSDLTNKGRGGKVNIESFSLSLIQLFPQVQFPPRKKPEKIWRNSGFNSRIKTMISR